MNRTQALLMMRAMVQTIETEQRVFNAAEQIEWDRLKAVAEAPEHLTPVSSAARSLGDCASSLIATLASATSARSTLPLRVKALSSDATGVTGTPEYPVAPMNLGPMSTYYGAVARLIDFLPSFPATGNAVSYVRVAYAASGNNAAKVPELGAKPESVLATTPVTSELSTFAHWLDASKQILDDEPGLRAIIDDTLRGGLLDVIDADVYAVLKTAGNFATYTPTAGDTTGDAVARVAAALANGGGRNIVVALNPADFLNIQLAKADGSGIYLGMPPNLASRTVAVPVVEAGKVLAFATQGAAWADREGVSVVAGLKNADFIMNMVTLLCEARGATIVRDPALIAFGNIATGA